MHNSVQVLADIDIAFKARGEHPGAPFLSLIEDAAFARLDNPRSGTVPVKIAYLANDGGNVKVVARSTEAATGTPAFVLTGGWIARDRRGLIGSSSRNQRNEPIARETVGCRKKDCRELDNMGAANRREPQGSVAGSRFAARAAGGNSSGAVSSEASSSRSIAATPSCATTRSAPSRD